MFSCFWPRMSIHFPPFLSKQEKATPEIYWYRLRSKHISQPYWESTHLLPVNKPHQWSRASLALPHVPLILRSICGPGRYGINVVYAYVLVHLGVRLSWATIDLKILKSSMKVVGSLNTPIAVCASTPGSATGGDTCMLKTFHFVWQ